MVMSRASTPVRPASHVATESSHASATRWASVASARAKLDTLIGGAKPEDLQNAQNAVQSAQANLATATAKRDQVVGGPLPTDVQLQEQSLVQAQIALSHNLLETEELHRRKLV